MKTQIERAARFEEAVKTLSPKIRAMLMAVPTEIRARTQEIRLRTNSPLSINTGKETYFIQNKNMLFKTPLMGVDCLSREDIEECFLGLCEYSVYSHQEDIKNGFITIKGGHRAGICGTAVTAEGKVVGVRNVSSINLRIARQINGAAEAICKEVFFNGLSGLLIAGAPSSGKTTILRDMARQLSGGCLGEPLRVAVVDERGELAGVYRGSSANNLGYCCDILNGYPKSEGIMQAVRSLSPDVILCDEIGSKEDIEAIEMGVNSGVSFIASIHAASLKELARKIQIKRLLETGAFPKIVLLGGRDNPGEINKILTEGDGDAQSLWFSLNSGGNNFDGSGGAA
ncbi:MAG: stage III sporulation protein AA [Oscillospiraceae bacterium]|jgi:stage III sporulation protein AA|nr:stage III sporulation protein AA [Oscillospiraceae bacterium]